jgi:NADPH:quinone reductase-like Zn-dependent oxidoreductase
VTGVPYILRLQSGVRRPRTPVRGTDAAGVVEAVGKNVTDLRPGDEVFGVVVDEGPRHVGHLRGVRRRSGGSGHQDARRPHVQSAGASVMSGITALLAMRDVGKVAPGTRVLINGASGGVGTFAVQIAHSLGAEVTGVCSTRERRAGQLARCRPRHRLHEGGLHAERAALCREPKLGSIGGHGAEGLDQLGDSVCGAAEADLPCG